MTAKILADHLYKERLGCYEHKVWMRGGKREQWKHYVRGTGEST